MDVTLNRIMEEIAETIGGQYSEYDDYKSVIIVPLKDNRYQSVLGVMKPNARRGKTDVEFYSKVCLYNKDIDLEALLKVNDDIRYGKFVVSSGYLQVKSARFLENMDAEDFLAIIREVADVADTYEHKLTGQDVH